MWESVRRLVQPNELEVIMYVVLFGLFFAESFVYSAARLERNSLREFGSNVAIVVLHNLGKFLFLPPLIIVYLWLFKWRVFEFNWNAVDFLIALFLVDLTYYVHHRSMHRIGLLWVVHAVHHQPRFVNLSMSTRLSFFNKALTYWFYLPLALVGIPLSLLAIAGLVNGFYQAITHSRTWRLPRLARYVFIDSRDHHLHHGKSVEAHDQNYGGMFSLWDRVFGTRAEASLTKRYDQAFSDGTIDYGLPGESGDPSVVNNPIWANLYPVRKLSRTVRARGWASLWRPPSEKA